tara:strand:+ start:88 stop:1257 length:1170 start_codon:yes stop_codon:yes gene_type:complete
MLSLLLGLCLIGNAYGEDLSESQTSYIGATMLEGNTDLVFDFATPLNPENNNAYAYFSGNTLYVGNEDDYGNMVDAIIEFFWFESSIDRGSDFYVAIIKARSNPGRELWVEDWTNYGSSPVLSVEALCFACGNSTGPDFSGAFRWDWAVPFDDYGIDAYGEIVFTNSYGLGASANGEAGAEGSAMAHGEYTENVEGDIKAAGDIQVKGYVNSDYRVQTQYQVMLYEWDVETTGTADTMAWDMYLNLEAREQYQAYHEYFLPVQVEEGQTFIIDQINVLGSFDNGMTQVTPYTMGVSLENIEISAPFWEPPEEEEQIPEPSEEEEEISQPEDEPQPEVDTGNQHENMPQLEEDSSESIPVKSCQTVTVKPNSWSYILGVFIGLLVFVRRK